MTWIIELEPGVWKAPRSGDAGRTLRKDAAKQYETERGAKIALGMARRRHPSPRAQILPWIADPPEQLYLVQDTRGTVGNCVSWWRPDGQGYTCNVDQAGRYRATDRRWRDTDILWPVEYVLAHAIRHFRTDRAGIGNPAAPGVKP